MMYRHVDFMTSSKFNSRMFSRIFAGYLENGSTDFHQTYVIFRKSFVVFLKLKD